MSKRQQGKSQETAAAKAAISERSGRRIEKGERPSIPGERHWRTVQITLGGESYSALADGLQSALFRAGGSPIEHRTDSLSAAFNNSVDKPQLTPSYEALCSHYHLQATRNNRGVSHENGAIECAHGSFKRRLDQALKLRGSGDFAAIKDYQAFLDTVTERLNKRCQSRFKDEQLALQALPCERFMDTSELSLKVTRVRLHGCRR